MLIWVKCIGHKSSKGVLISLPWCHNKRYLLLKQFPVDPCWRADLSNDLCSSSGQLQYLYCWLCSIGSVRQDCIFLTHEILKLICGRINYCLYCRLCLLNWLETLLCLLNMDLVGEQKYIIYCCLQKKQMWVKSFICICRAVPLAAISIREFTSTI